MSPSPTDHSGVWRLNEGPYARHVYLRPEEAGHAPEYEARLAYAREVKQCMGGGGDVTLVTINEDGILTIFNDPN